MPSSRAARWLVVAALLPIAVGTPALARDTLVVAPGPGTPLQDAIDAAAPGSRILLASGPDYASSVFREAIVIDKPLRITTLEHSPEKIVRIIAPCGADAAVRITGGGVRLQPPTPYTLMLEGGTHATLAIDGASDVVVRGVQTRAYDAGCDTLAGSAIDVDRSARVTISGQYAEGGTNAVIRIGHVAEAGKIDVRFMSPEGAPIGVLVEGVDAAVRGRVRIHNVWVGPSETGILVRAATGVLISANNVYGSSVAGIHLEPSATGNRIKRNTADASQHFPGSIDVIDEGSGNWWWRNRFTTGAVAQ